LIFVTMAEGAKAPSV